METQKYVKSNKSEVFGEFQEVINVLIEAPVVLVPNEKALWVADLGTFQISKSAGIEGNKNPNLLAMEGRDTKLFFTQSNESIFNLNEMMSEEEAVLEYINSLNLIVSDLHFNVELFKTPIEDEAKAKVKNVSTVNLSCQPVTVQVVPRSMESFVDTIYKLNEDSTRIEKKIKKILSKAEYTCKEGFEYNLGYEEWEKVIVAIENLSLYLISHSRKILATYKIDSLRDSSLNEIEGDSKQLLLDFRHSKVTLKAAEQSTLTELQFKLNSLKSLLMEEGRIAENQDNLADDYRLCLTFDSLELQMAGQSYHSKGLDFVIKIQQIKYESQYLEGVENGSLEIQQGAIFDCRTDVKTIELKAPSAEHPKALTYTFKYEYGKLESTTSIQYLHALYKVEYIQSLLYLTEFVMGRLINKEPLKTDVSEENLLEIDMLDQQPPVRYNTLKSQFTVIIERVLVELYYKADICCVEIVTDIVSLSIATEGTTRRVLGQLTGLGAYDLQAYPFRPEAKDQSGQRYPLVFLEQDGMVNLDVVLKESSSKATYWVNNCTVNWVQQRCMRLIDFLMYQVLELFYPSLVSLSKYYSRSSVIRSAVAALNSDQYMLQEIEMNAVKMNIPSTTNPAVGIAILAPTCTIKNHRLRTPRIVGCSEKFPFPDLESEQFHIDVKQVTVNLFPDKCISKPFDLDLVFELPKKIFELGLLYSVVDDECKMESTFRDKLFLLTDGHKRRTGKILQPLPLQEARAWADRAIQSTGDRKKPRIYLDGRYHLSIAAQRIELILSNEVINAIYDVSCTNITFDDGRDELLKNTYVANTGGVMLFLAAKVNNIVAKVSDFLDPSFELFRLAFNKFEVCVNKRSDFINLIDFCALDSQATFSPGLDMPQTYLNFIHQDKKQQLDLLEDCLDVQNEVKGTIKLTPDGMKDIEVEFSNGRIIVFNFLLRLLPELLGLKQLREHRGYEEVSQSRISMMIKVNKAELCLPSNQDCCLAIKSSPR